MTDQLSELESIVATNSFFDAQGATFTIAGDFVPPDGSRIFNLNLVQLNPTATRRTLKKIGGGAVGPANVNVVAAAAAGAAGAQGIVIVWEYA